MTEPPIKTCPTCGGQVRRLIGAGAGIIFKGSGFYQTDYRSDSYKKKAEAEKKETSGGKQGGSSDKTAERGSKPSEPKANSSSP